MPKERRDKSVSFDRCKASPYSCSSSRVTRSSSKIPLETDDNIKEWEDARCPVCMEHPHNAVLLICSSHDKGCRPYMCDTSHRHSNCLDQFRKSFVVTSKTETTPEEGEADQVPISETSALDNSESGVNDMMEEDESEEAPATPRTSFCENQQKAKMLCPLCRGDIVKWTVVDSARHFMNAKARNCSCETCNFSGTYKDLRRHARIEHPTVRPSDTDPERARNWNRMERQRDLGDLLSTLESSFGREERGAAAVENVLPMSNGSWLTVLLFIRVGPSTRSSSGSGGGSNLARRTRAPTRARRRSPRLWGESHDVEAAETSIREEDGNNESSDDDEPLSVIRRRTYRPSTPDDDEP